MGELDKAMDETVKDLRSRIGECDRRILAAKTERARYARALQALTGERISAREPKRGDYAGSNAQD